MRESLIIDKADENRICFMDNDIKKTKLYSKRNSVYRTCSDSKTYIVKKFSNTAYMAVEKEILDILYVNDVNVPQILFSLDDEIVLEDLGDVTFLDWLENEEENSRYTYHKMIIAFLSFLQKFYKITSGYFKRQYIINDVNLRNFLVNNNKIYGIDFELCTEGKIETDVAKIVAYIITYNPAETDWKYRFVNDFLHIFLLNLNLNIVFLIQEITSELYRISKRRNLYINVEEIVCKIAEEII